MFCEANIIHRIKWNNNGCLMYPRWFSKHYFFNNCNYKVSHVPDHEVPEDKRKAYKTYLKKIRSWCHRPGPSGIRPNWSRHLGTLCRWINNPREVTEDVRQILQRLMNAGPGTVSQKGIQRIDRGANPRTVSQKYTQVIHTKTALLRLDRGGNPGIVSPKCIPTALTRLDWGANPGLVSQKCIPTWLRHRKVMIL